jgi:hypothetical protein
MPPLLTGYTEKAALRWLTDATQADLDPVLTTDELRSLLAVARIADEDGNLPDPFEAWVASEAYPVGERVVPAIRNGYVYRVTAAGTSGVSAPTWSTTIDATVTDGSVTWTVEDTAPYVPTYDATRINRAAAEGWRRKIDKLGTLMQVSSGDDSINPDGLRKAWAERAASFAKKGGAGTIDLSCSPSDRYRPNVVLVSS